MIAAGTRAIAGKELRALLPAWVATMMAVGAGALMGGLLTGPALAAFAIGAVVLGAQAVGHEYTHGTLAASLALPVDRRRVFAVKLVVLAALLAPLAWLAGELILRHPWVFSAWDASGLPSHVAIPSLALCVAPALTMTARGVLPGAVFTLTVPVVLLVAGDLTGLVLHGADAAAHVDAVKTAVFRWGVPIACALGGVAGWRAFVRLETYDAPRADVQIPAWTIGSSRAREERRGRPLMVLAAKELRLQQLTLVCAALYAALALTAASIEWAMPGTAHVPLGAFTGLYVLVLPLIAGAIASADERLFGTHEPQLLLPIATRTQWAVKASIAIVGALALGCGLPLAVAAVHPGAAGVFPTPRLWELGALVVLLTSCSLYASSWSTSGVRALVSSLALTFGLLMMASLVQRMDPLLAPSLPRGTSLVADLDTYRTLMAVIFLVTAACLSAALLRFGLTNYRSARPNVATIGTQLVVVLAIVACSSVALSVFQIVAWPGLRGN